MSQTNELQGIRPPKGKCFSGSNVIDLLSRWKYDRCLAAVATVLGFPLDMLLVSVFIASLQRALVVPRYRAAYSWAGRRNRPGIDPVAGGTTANRKFESWGGARKGELSRAGFCISRGRD